MYASHFGLETEPFSIAPDPRFLFMSPRHREALAHLLYGLRGGGGFVLLTGEIGAGKTTVVRGFIEQLPEDCRVAYVFNPRLSATELLEAVCEEFGIALEPQARGSAKRCVDALNAFLLREHAAGRQCVLVIDEAQQLAPELLEQLRLLTNLETSERKLLQIVLVGQPELQRTLAGLEQLSQRVIARYHLDALSSDEVRQYVAHRLAVAGLKGELPFDAGALRRIAALSRGVPRRVNLLCDRALLGAYAQGRHRVDAATVRQAAAEVAGTPASLRRRPWAAGMALAGVAGLATAAWLLLRPPGTGGTVAAAPGAAAALPGAAGRAEPAARAASAAAAAPASGTEAAEATLDALPLLGSEREAWRELASLWGAASDDAEACAASSGAQRPGCFRAGGLGLAPVRQYDRPGLLALRDGQGRPGWALLVGLDAQTATLRAQGRQVRVPLAALASRWQGDWASFWRVPPGYARALAAGDDGETVQALATLLARAQGRVAPAPAPRRLDGALLADLRAFQLAQGLRPDGVAGPGTFMLLNRAAGLDEPRLQPSAAPAGAAVPTESSKAP